MSIQTDIQAQLGQLVNNPPSAWPAEIAVEGRAGRVSCDVQAVEQLACSLDEIQYQAQEPFGQTPAGLTQMGEALANRVSYLLEPIGNYELDEDGMTLQMRSIPPSGDRENLSFYELLLRCSGEIRIYRYQQSAGSVREKVPMEFTRQVLGRLGNDLDDLVADRD
jgi:hypothetical protein